LLSPCRVLRGANEQQVRKPVPHDGPNYPFGSGGIRGTLAEEGAYSLERISESCDAKIAGTSAPDAWICSTKSAIRGVITRRYSASV
jgi:hypothetical protein